MKSNSFVKGAVILVLFNLIGKVLGAVYRIPLANLLGSVGIGKYQLIFPLYSLMLSVSVSGIPVAISKLVSEYNGKGMFGDVKRLIKLAFLYLVGISVVCCLFVVIGARFIACIQGNSEIYLCYYGIAPAILFVALLSVFRGYFQGQMNMTPSALSGLIEQIGRLLLGLFLAKYFIKFGLIYGVLGAVIGISVSELMALIFLMIYYFAYSSKKRFKGAPKLTRNQISNNCFKMLFR
jgi:stage V sporulation protein B